MGLKSAQTITNKIQTLCQDWTVWFEEERFEPNTKNQYHILCIFEFEVAVSSYSYWLVSANFVGNFLHHTFKLLPRVSLALLSLFYIWVRVSRLVILLFVIVELFMYRMVFNLFHSLLWFPISFHCHVALRSWQFWWYEVVQGVHDDQSDLVLSPFCKSFSVQQWRAVMFDDGRHSENDYFCRNAAVVPACKCKIWNLQFTASILASHASMSTKIAAQCHDAAFHFKVYISSFHSCHCSNSDKSLPRFRVPGYHMSHLSIRLIQVWPS